MQQGLDVILQCSHAIQNGWLASWPIFFSETHLSRAIGVSGWSSETQWLVTKPPLVISFFFLLDSQCTKFYMISHNLSGLSRVKWKNLKLCLFNLLHPWASHEKNQTAYRKYPDPFPRLRVTENCRGLSTSKTGRLRACWDSQCALVNQLQLNSGKKKEGRSSPLSLHPFQDLINGYRLALATSIPF